MRKPPIVNLLLVCGLLGIGSDAMALTPCEEALVGDFARQPGGRPLIRIEVVDGKPRSHLAGNDGSWDTEFEEGRFLNLQEVNRLTVIAKEGEVCGVTAGGGTLVKVPVGSPYSVSSPEGPWVIKNTRAPFVHLVQLDYFLQGIELYRVPPT